MPISSDVLIAFEREVAERFEAGEILGPVHLSGGNEKQLISIFQDIKPTDWVFCSYRSHFHALLHGIPPDLVMGEIVAKKSMNLSFPEYRFMSSAIVAGCLPIAVGVAKALKLKKSMNSVFCFVGDMAAKSGAFHEAMQYAAGHRLPIRFVIEDNGLSCDSPTSECWGDTVHVPMITRYIYTRAYPHVGTGKYVSFV